MKLLWAIVSLLVLVTAVPNSFDDLQNAEIVSVRRDRLTGRLTLHSGLMDGALAWGRFADSVTKTGWGFLDVHSNQSESNENQAQAAGYLEGSQTVDRTWQTAVNGGILSPLDPRVEAWYVKNNDWIQQQIQANPSSNYWQQIKLIELQFQGLVQGYNDKAKPAQKLTEMQLRRLSLGDEVGDVSAGILPEYERPDPSERASHCSALIKVLADKSDVFMSQVTWSSFNSMLRVYKLYDLPFTMQDGSIVPGQKISFSGYPGSLFSGDDFYQMSPSGIVSQETTIGVYDGSLYKKFISFQTVPEWMRNMLANRMAHDAPEWCTVFEQFNSGTYNNEWMVLNYNQVQPGRPLPTNTFMVLDQIPGHVHYGDLSGLLNSDGYFPSYNVAYWPDIFNISGAPAMVQKYGSWFSHDETARALIFKRDHVKVTSMAAMQAMMRYNDFKNDPLSRCDGCNPPYTSENTISTRGDLNPKDGTWPISAYGFRNHAGTDAKIVNKALMDQFRALVISGPTNDIQPTFAFSTSLLNVSHIGLPDSWDFPWVHISWS